MNVRKVWIGLKDEWPSIRALPALSKRW